MTLRVPYIADDAIERDAEALLARSRTSSRSTSSFASNSPICTVFSTCRVRAYVIFPSREHRRLSGARDIARFIEEAVRTGIPAELFEGAQIAGPLATFEGADCWVDRPYRDGVVLIGDAAATLDPSWGQGLSLAVRDIRLLRDALLTNVDWDVAGREYAVGHDYGYATIHATEDWFSTLFLETGPEADTRRKQALPLIAEEPDRVPDVFMSGPDASPVDDNVRRRFFGEV